VIPIELFQHVTTIVTHDRCPDGLASAIVLLNAYDGKLSPKDVVFHHHMSDAYEKLEARPGMLFCDITPPPARAQEFIDAGAIVLDHHEAEKVAPYGALGVHSKVAGVSGAVLAFQEVWLALQESRQPSAVSRQQEEVGSVIKDFAVLAGIRDTWQKTDPRWREACAQAAALMFWPREQWLAEATELRRHLGDRLSIGPTLLDKRAGKLVSMFASHHKFTSRKGLKIVVVNSTDTSDLAELIRESLHASPPSPDAPDVLIGFEYKTDAGIDRMTLSCRTLTDVLVQPFCAYYGGGGHPPAAGVTLSVDRQALNPYHEIELLWNVWERVQDT
jgi:hypothetical protein